MKKKRFLLVSLLLVCISCFTIGLSGCGCGGVVLSAPQNVAYDGTYITWNAVSGAEYYNVTINSGNEIRCNSTVYSFDSLQNSFDVTISAVAKNNSISTNVNFKPLDTITNLTVNNDGTISWSSVEGATAYQISINGQIVPINAISTYYDKLPVGYNRVKVKPIVTGDSSYFSKFSIEKVVQIYAAPSNLKYDNEVISWNGNASKYAVTINSATTVVETNEMPYTANNVDFVVSVKCEGDHVTTFDSKSISTEYKYLGTITDCVVEDGNLKWSPIEKATGYKIKINNVLQQNILTTTEYTKLSSGASYEVELKPINENGNYFSSWSAIKNIYILESPKISWNNGLELDGQENNNIFWDSVTGANGYTINVTKDNNASQEFHNDSIQTSFRYAFAEVGTYKVEVKSNADATSANTYDSKYSTVMTVKRLEAPKEASNNFVTSDKNSLAKGFTVNYQLVTGASGYQLYKDGKLLDGKSSTTNSIVETSVIGEDVITANTINYSIRSLGKYVSGSNYVALPCLSSAALKFEIKVQATPQNLVMNGYMLNWNNVEGSGGYSVKISSNSYTATNNTYDLSIINMGEYRVDVCARGDGQKTLASNYSSPVNISRLDYPKNIKITSEANGSLVYDVVANAKSHEVYLGLSTQELNKDQVNNMYAHIHEEGTTLYMKAVANCYNADNTLYYMTSKASPTQMFIRLSTPVIPESAVSNSAEFVWNTPANINTKEYTPTYWLKRDSDSNVLMTGNSATKLDISDITAGEHNFQVKAKGDGIKYLDSDYSELFTFTKLATPDLVVDKVNGCYTWNYVNNATSYYMEIDGTKVTDEFESVNATTYKYTPRFTTKTDHTVTLKAIGNGTSIINSDKETYIQKTDILTLPIFNCSYSNESYVVGGKITVNITTPSLNSKAYRFNVGAGYEDYNGTTYEVDVNSTGKYEIYIIALGGIFDENEIYYINSNPTTTQSIIFLPAPNYLSISIDASGNFNWEAVTNALGYDFQIAYNDEDYGAIQHKGVTSHQLAEGKKYIKTYSSLKIKIRACGNENGTIITSEWVEYIWTNRS